MGTKVHKTIAEARKHLEEAIPNIPARYKASTARADWETPSTTEESEANYRAGLSESMAEDRRRIRIHAAGNAKFKSACELKGAPVIGERIRQSLAIYERNFAPVMSAMIAAADAAPAKTRDPMANIDQRLKPVVRAAILAKTR